LQFSVNGLKFVAERHELEQMFLHGVEVVMRPGGGGEAEARPSRDQEVLRAGAGNGVTGWLRVVLGEGVELHLSDQRPKMTLEERRQILKRIEELVREIYG
jgi:hypothetical protein